MILCEHELQTGCCPDMEKDLNSLSPAEIDRIVEMAWEDRTPFEAIEHQFGLNEQDVIRLMRREMTQHNWKKWRSRVQGRKTKHQKLQDTGRFRSGLQRNISGNRISKKKY